jgi:hypothetical protein
MNSFIKKWPRGKRQTEKGPSEKIEIIEVKFPREFVEHSAGMRGIVYFLAKALLMEVNKHCPKGWARENVERPAYNDDLVTGMIRGQAKIRYYRVSK